MSKLKKYVEESKNTKNPELEIIDRGISNLLDAPGLCEYFLGGARLIRLMNGFISFSDYILMIVNPLHQILTVILCTENFWPTVSEFLINFSSCELKKIIHWSIF